MRFIECISPMLRHSPLYSAFSASMPVRSRNQNYVYLAKLSSLCSETGYTWLDECRSVVKSLERLRGEIAQGAGLDLDPTAGELFGKNPHHFMTDMADEFCECPVADES